MGANLNALIAKGGTDIASPIQKYLSVRKDMNGERRNALAESQVKQQMNFGAENQQMKRDEQTKKSLAALGKYLDSVPEEMRDKAFEMSRPNFPKFGLPQLPAETKYKDVAAKIDQAKLEVYGQPKGTRRNALFNNEIVPAIENEQGQFISPQTGQRMPGATIAPTRQTTGDPGAYSGYLKDTAKDKDMKIAIESEEGLRNLGKNINRIKDTLNNSTDYVGGITGSIVQLINSGQMQFEQIMGNRDPLADASGKIDSKQLGNLSKENIGWIRKAAIEGKRVDSAILELAFTHAKILNNSGKISDADIKYARDIIEGGADKATKVDSLNNLLERGYSNYTQQRKTRGGRGKLQENWKDISRDEIFGAGFQPVGQASPQDEADANTAATEALKSMGMDY